MAEAFIGEIRLVGFNYAPRSWAFCDGSVMAISQNTALFALLGTSYGGNGTTTYRLPDLRGRVPVGQGQGAGLSSYDLGQQDGQEGVSLDVSTMPAHRHPVNVSSAAATTVVASGNVPAKAARNIYIEPAATEFAADTLSPQGQGQPHNNMGPYLAINYIIALEGIFPSRP